MPCGWPRGGSVKDLPLSDWTLLAIALCLALACVLILYYGGRDS